MSGFKPSSETTALRYLKLVTVPSFWRFTFNSLWVPLALFVISLVFSVTDFHLVCRFCRDFLLGYLFPALPQLCIIGKPQICNISAAYANLSIMTFQSIRHNLLEENDEESGWQKTSLPYLDCWFWPILPCCHSSGLHLQPCRRAALSCELDLHWYCTSAWWPIRLHAILCQRLFWNHWRHGLSSA